MCTDVYISYEYWSHLLLSFNYTENFSAGFHSGFNPCEPNGQGFYSLMGFILGSIADHFVVAPCVTKYENY